MALAAKVIARLSCSVVAVALVIFAAGCKGGGPTTPTRTPARSRGETFEVTGVVTDDRGAQLSGAAVTMTYWLDGRVRRPFVLRDVSGGDTVGFNSQPWVGGTRG